MNLLVEAPRWQGGTEWASVATEVFACWRGQGVKATGHRDLRKVRGFGGVLLLAGGLFGAQGVRFWAFGESLIRWMQKAGFCQTPFAGGEMCDETEDTVERCVCKEV